MPDNVRPIRPISPADVGRTMDQVLPERVDWMSRGRIAYGKITICDGDPGLGKSTMLMDIAAKISRGEPPSANDPLPRKRGVIIIGLEDDPADTVRPRLEVSGAVLSRIRLIDEIPILDDAGAVIPDKSRLFELPGDVPLLEQIVTDMNAGLIIIDPLIGFLQSGLSDNNGRDIRDAIQPLVKMLQRTKAACVLLRHLNKSQSSNGLYRGAGSVQISALARLVMMVAKHPEEPTKRILSMTKSNLGPMVPGLVFSLESVEDRDVARVAWHGTTEMTSDEILQSALVSDEDRQERNEAETLLYEEVANGPKSNQQLAKAFSQAGLSPTALKHAKKNLKRAKRVEFTPIRTATGDAFGVYHLPGINVRSAFFADPWSVEGERAE
ncbi:MAG: AAA family ATPase [Rhodanobacteraceae bacterium]|nr:AAA family ATPase [Rhodanobacteraceae bacterium]